jgi:ATP-dependent DNA helicase PIF1
MPHDSRAQLIRDTSVITWDEAPMTSKVVLACMEEVCRLATGINTPFGGKTVILLGDFRQTCPVIRRGSRADVIHASIKSSPFWPLFNTFHLTQPIRNAEDEEYAAFLDTIGNGAGSNIDLSTLPKTNSRHETVQFVFPANWT